VGGWNSRRVESGPKVDQYLYNRRIELAEAASHGARRLSTGAFGKPRRNLRAESAVKTAVRWTFEFGGLQRFPADYARGGGGPARRSTAWDGLRTLNRGGTATSDLSRAQGVVLTTIEGNRTTVGRETALACSGEWPPDQRHQPGFVDYTLPEAMGGHVSSTPPCPSNL
jgi:hypothetical protein